MQRVREHYWSLCDTSIGWRSANVEGVAELAELPVNAGTAFDNRFIPPPGALLAGNEQVGREE